MLKEIKRIKATRIVIDPISLFAMALKDPYEIRKQIYSLTKLLKQSKCTILITSEIVGESSLELQENQYSMNLSRYGVEEFVAESVTTLHSSGLGGVADRALSIIKMRRTNHIKGPVPMKITGKGIEVLSRKSSYK